MTAALMPIVRWAENSNSWTHVVRCRRWPLLTLGYAIPGGLSSGADDHDMQFGVERRRLRHVDYDKRRSEQRDNLGCGTHVPNLQHGMDHVLPDRARPARS